MQAVEAFPGGEHAPGSTVKCTYISIPQAPRTHAVVLSKPTWMWGAEMVSMPRSQQVALDACRPQPALR